MKKTPLYVILFKVFHAQRGLTKPYTEERGLSPGQPKLLRYLAQEKKCLQKDLAIACDLEPGTISKLLNTMEENGLITRNTIEQDKRAIQIALTQKGLAEHKIVSVHMKEIEELGLTGFSQEEREQFQDLLCRFYKNLTKKEIE